MGSFVSKNLNEDVATTPTNEHIIKLIEDPRSPTEEISRTPIEVSDKIQKREAHFLSRAKILKEKNIDYSNDLSPRIRKAEWNDEDFKKLKNPFTLADEKEVSLSVSNADVTNNPQLNENPSS